MAKGQSERLSKSLARTRQGFFGQIARLLRGPNEITPELWDDLEALLIQADVGVETTMELIERLQERVRREHIRQADAVRAVLREELLALLQWDQPRRDLEERLLTVILIVGVNGSGKTTTIAKLGKYYQALGKRVLFAAADTFRAAAIDQLQLWGNRLGVGVIAHAPGADPGAVVYDAIQASRARSIDVLIIDTAGRLHTKHNLMQELKKIRGIAAKQVHQAPHETWLVLDATTGQNALSQARHFKDAVEISGVILTKLDGTAKGGVVFAINRELGLPVRFVGTGESIDDLAEFDAEIFVDSLLE